MIEHAVYASRRSQLRDGYQVVAASSGAAAEDLRDMPVWCPSHDGLIRHDSGATSINAWQSASGAHCVARSIATQGDYSGRGGVHVITHALFLDPKTFASFANNPFAVAEAALAAGHLLSVIPASDQLQPLRLLGRARPFGRSAVQQVVQRVGLPAFCRALDTALVSETFAAAVIGESCELLAAILNCLPVPLRAAISLSTGLVYSSRRPYQWMIQPNDPIALRRLERQHGVACVQVGDQQGRESDSAVDVDGFRHAWTSWIAQRLQQGQYLDVERQFRKLPDVANVAELDNLACELIGHSAKTGPAPAQTSGQFQVASAHAAHATRQELPDSRRPDDVPSRSIVADTPEATRRLEALDRTVAAAVSGDRTALAHTEQLWDELSKLLSTDAAETSRESYLRFALSRWEDRRKTSDPNAEQTSAAVELIALFAGETVH